MQETKPISALSNDEMLTYINELRERRLAALLAKTIKVATKRNMNVSESGELKRKPTVASIKQQMANLLKDDDE